MQDVPKYLESVSATGECAKGFQTHQIKMRPREAFWELRVAGEIPTLRLDTMIRHEPQMAAPQMSIGRRPK